jgi:alkylhydroperoxidase family enzyme
MTEIASTEGAVGPRISPGSRAQIGRLNFALARLIGAGTGGGPPNVFTTLARNRRLFRAWLRFAGRLMPGGSLPRAQTELVVLRVAHNCGSEYEWAHHERLGHAAGLAPDEIERVREGPEAGSWSPAQVSLLRAADELHQRRTISDELWGELSRRHAEPQLIELCMLVGHYEMLAMTLNALGVQPDPPGGRVPRPLRLVQRLAERRGRAERPAAR